MTKNSKKTMNFWVDRKVSHWVKKNDFKMWSNLSAFQRKVLVTDIRVHLIQMFELGRKSILNEIKEIV